MDDVTETPPSARRFTVINIFFIVVVALGLAYILWRGFASEASSRPTPLFGHMATLEWNGKKQGFMLVAYADLGAVKAGDLLIRHGEVPTRVWEVVSRSGSQVAMRSPNGGSVEERTVTVPPDATAQEYVLLAPTGGQ